MTPQDALRSVRASIVEVSFSPLDGRRSRTTVALF
jgi:hypothetical protein